MKRIFKRIVALLLLVAVVLGVATLLQGYALYKRAVEKLPLEQAVEQVRSQPNYTTLDELSSTYIDAVVAVEDKRFYDHNGIDIAATVRAIVNDIKAGSFVEGGSTITQQLAKNLYFTQEKVLVRKVAELLMAFDIEAEYSKEDILELYLNSIYFGSGYYCVYDASMGYFGCAPGEMSDYQATLLAGIPNAPSVYSLDESPDLAHQRQEYVLYCMAECGYISQQQAQEILEEAPEAQQ